MGKKDILFELIKSLSKSEKRYFKLYASRNQSKGNKYIKLFDAIDKQVAYDEKLILESKKLGKEVTDNFSFNKHYLYQLLLRALNSFHSEISTDVVLKGMLISVEVLFQKGLFSQCEKLILKGKKIAQKYENHISLMGFLKWETELMRVKSHIGLEEKDIAGLYRQVFKSIEYHKNSNDYSKLLSLTAIFNQKLGTIRKTKELKAIQALGKSELLNHRLLKNENKTLTHEAKIHFYFVYFNYYFQFQDLNKAKYYTERQVETIESQPHLIEENPTAYISALNNLIICNKHLHNDNIFPLIDKLKNISFLYKVKSELVRNTIFYRACNLELDQYIRMGEFERGLPLIKEINLTLKNSHIKIINKEREVVLFYNIAYVYFGAGKYNLANQFLNKIVNDEKTDIRADLYSFARIFQLVVHYEMGNDLLLEYMVKSIYRFLYKKNRLYKFETCILQFIKTKMPYMNSEKETVVAFIQLKNELTSLFKNEFEKTSLDYFDFISWLISKIENEKFENVVRINYLKAKK